MDKKHFGSTLDSLFEEMGELEDMNERRVQRLSRHIVLTAEGSRTLMDELDDSKPAVVSEKLRALLRGLRTR